MVCRRGEGPDVPNVGPKTGGGGHIMPSLSPPQPCLQSGSSVLVGSDKGSGGGFLNFFPLDMITDQAVRQDLALNSELCWDAGWDPLLQLQTVRVAQ